MQPGIVIYTSNRLEDLLEVLAEQLAGDPLEPLQPETILVPGQGMARWLRFALAEKHGIAAGLELPFPGAYMQQLVRKSDATDSDLFAPEVLPFRIHRLLGTEANRREFGLAAKYCEDDSDGKKRFQLSLRLATCFEHYQLYRRDLLAAAAKGEDLDKLSPHGTWQARLWRALLTDAGQLGGPKRKTPAKANPTPLLFGDPEPAAATDEIPLAHRLLRLERALDDPEQAKALLPQRLQVFGTSTLPPAMLSLLMQIGRTVPVALYLPQPTPHYIGDLRPSRLPSARGSDLLARLSTEVREFQDLLLDLEESTEVERRDLHGEIGEWPTSLLASVQHGLMAVDERGDHHALGRVQLLAGDDSLRVHDCHSPQRELEVVRDQILAAFASDDSLAPHDVLILVPDIERYAPYAEAVFGPVAEHLPFQVADRNPAIDSPIPASLCRLMRLARGRLPVFDVLHLLEEPAVQRRFRLFASDLPVLRHLCERAGIRWGLDGEMRERQFRVPPFEDNTWRQGVERMLLGAVTGPLDDLVLGCLPSADATSSREVLLARFVTYLQTLFAQLRHLQRSHSLPEWADRLDGAAAALFQPATAEDDQGVAELRRATTELRTIADHARITEPISAQVLEDWLQRALRHAAGSHGFLGGRVTIAAMLPMRAVPVRCLFLCGLDDLSFPRRDQPETFDLVAAQRRSGDRSARLDDRQMFLDCLLAARQQLHLTYVGHSQKDDSPCTPSAVLCELLDSIERSCSPPDGFDSARAFVTVRHPLQPWSPRYRLGDDARLFTFGTGTQRFTVTDLEPRPWSHGTVSPPAELSSANLRLDWLVEFWWHPCRYFLRHVLRLKPPRNGDSDLATESFSVSNLDRYRLLDAAVERNARTAKPPRDALQLAMAGGLLPVGGVGAAAFAQVEEESAQFLAELEHWGDLEPQPVSVQGSGFTIEGLLPAVAADAIVQSRVGKLQPKDRLRAWLFHIVAAVARDQSHMDLPVKTVVVARDQTVAYGQLPKAAAHEQLSALVAGFRLGITEPLPFFEKSSHAYGKSLHEGKEAPAALHSALAEWLPQQREFSFPDSVDREIALCMRDRDPLHEPAFGLWAQRIWQVVRGYTEAVS